MSIFIEGTSACQICEKKIGKNQSFQLMPAFIFNQTDPLFTLSDGAVHERCLRRHPDKAAVERALGEYFEKTGPGNRRCSVCSEEITDPEDYILIPALTRDSTHPLFGFNFTHLHKSHMGQWEDLNKVIPLMKQLSKSGWSGFDLEGLIFELTNALK